MLVSSCSCVDHDELQEARYLACSVSCNSGFAVQPFPPPHCITRSTINPRDCFVQLSDTQAIHTLRCMYLMADKFWFCAEWLHHKP